MKQFATFIAATLLWAGIARLILETDTVHPIAIGIVWLVGFVWITSYIAAGPDDADHLTKVWLGMLAGIVVLGGIGAAMFS